MDWPLGSMRCSWSQLDIEELQLVNPQALSVTVCRVWRGDGAHRLDSGYGAGLKGAFLSC